MVFFRGGLWGGGVEFSGRGRDVGMGDGDEFVGGGERSVPVGVGSVSGVGEGWLLMVSAGLGLRLASVSKRLGVPVAEVIGRGLDALEGSDRSVGVAADGQVDKSRVGGAG